MVGVLAAVTNAFRFKEFSFDFNREDLKHRFKEIS